jgi:hypothetical protein
MSKKEVEKIRKAVSRVDNMMSKASLECHGLARLFKFEGFNVDDEPTTNMTGDGIILVWHGDEMFIDQAIEIMEDQGYISTDNFTAYDDF